MILVVGATDVVGGVLVRQLLDQGNSVRILVRPQSNFQTLMAKEAQPVLGDLKRWIKLVTVLTPFLPPLMWPGGYSVLTLTLSKLWRCREIVT